MGWYRVSLFRIPSSKFVKVSITPDWTAETQLYSLHLSIHEKRKGGKAGACPVHAVRDGEKRASLSTAGVKRIGGGHDQTVVTGLELWTFIDFPQ